MKVLITGSRDCSSDMEGKVKEVVKWIIDQDYELLVGDAPGVDHIAFKEMVSQGYAHRVTVFGAFNTSRVRHFKTKVTHLDYLARDRVMAIQCDMCVAIWDSSSGGTLYTFNFARSQGKKVILRTFYK